KPMKYGLSIEPTTKNAPQKRARSAIAGQSRTALAWAGAASVSGEGERVVIGSALLSFSGIAGDQGREGSLRAVATGSSSASGDSWHRKTIPRWRFGNARVHKRKVGRLVCSPEGVPIKPRPDGHEGGAPRCRGLACGAGNAEARRDGLPR